MERLEIYNERAKKTFEIDLKPDSSVSLQLKSNLFSPIDKITLNHSFTIQAPDTLQNRRAFGMGNQVAAESDQVRQKFPCKFYRNGVHILTGTCHVQSVESGSFSLLLVWGLDCLEALKEGGDLKDLNLGNMEFKNVDATTGRPVPYYSTYAEAMENVMFHAYSKAGMAAKNEWNLAASHLFTPCIAARTLFKKCLESAGITYEVDEEAFEFMKRLAIPLPTLDTGLLEVEVDGIAQIDRNAIEDYYVVSNRPIVLKESCYFTGFTTHVTNVEVRDNHTLRMVSAGNSVISFYLAGNEALNLDRFRMCVIEADDNGDEKEREYKKLKYTRLEKTNGYTTYYFDDIEISGGEQRKIYFIYDILTDENLDFSSFKLRVTKMTIELDEPPITIGMELSIAFNLPKLSKINFVKALCQICGIFPIPPVDGSNVVRFVAPGILEKNKANAVDWSGYVIGEPKKIAFAFSDFAQNNLITYKDGERYAASFQMESPTAEKEKTAFELPFMHLEGGRWPLWSVEQVTKDNKTFFEWSRESVDPAIYCLIPSGGDDSTYAYLSFDELTPNMILSRWRPLADAVKRAKVIQVELLLPQVAVKYVDYSVPVYIEQFGGYFGIVSLTNAGDKTTAELIKI